MRRRGGGGLLCCLSEWATYMLVSSILQGDFLSFFALFSLFLCRSVFDLLCLLLRYPVLPSVLRVSFSCLLWPFRLLATSPLFLWLLPSSLVSLSFPLGLSIPLVACLASSIRLSSRWSLLPFSCCCLFFLSLPWAPVCCLLHFTPLSLLRWLCPALIPGFQFSLVLFCFRFPSSPQLGSSS